jgi:D-tyrosyl-tRNA(Tyr) deacylase
MMLLGVSEGDTREDCELLARKALNLRIFTDENGKMNLSVKDVGGEALVVSNFTLMANYRKGNRPDYLAAAKPDEANALYEYFLTLMRGELKNVGSGVFGAHMEIDICADGPVTIVMESEELKPKK